MCIHNCVRLPKLRSRKTGMVGESHLWRQPKLRFPVRVRDMDMNTRLLPRKKEETKLAVTNNSRCHAVTVTNLSSIRVTLALNVTGRQYANPDAATFVSHLSSPSLLTPAVGAALERGVRHYLLGGLTDARIVARSWGTGWGLNGLTLEPPVLPVGTRPIAVLVAAPTIRKTWPSVSRNDLLRIPQRNMCQ